MPHTGWTSIHKYLQIVSQYLRYECVMRWINNFFMYRKKFEPCKEHFLYHLETKINSVKINISAVWFVFDWYGKHVCIQNAKNDHACLLTNCMFGSSVLFSTKRKYEYHKCRNQKLEKILCRLANHETIFFLH